MCGSTYEENRTTDKLMNPLNFDYFKLLDLVTIARSRKHIEKILRCDIHWQVSRTQQAYQYQI